MKNLINHVAFVIDASGSMSGLQDKVIKVFDKQIQDLADASKDLNQETRVTVYSFNTKVECLIFDMDVLRVPSLKNIYKADGGTALLDATLLTINDLEETFQKYGDHAFLVYVLTDGQENSSQPRAKTMVIDKLKKLGENWTFAALVPDISGHAYAKQCGFPVDNIQIWTASNVGIDKVDTQLRQATRNYMQARSKGIRGTSNLFSLDTQNLNTKVVQSNLDCLSSSEYTILPVGRDVPIKELVEGFMGSYTIGSAYYLLNKPEKVQAQKQICIQHKRTGKLYSGRNARDLLGLPDSEVKVAPVTYTDYNIYVQSTSVNRKLLKGTNVVVMK